MKADSAAFAPEICWHLIPQGNRPIKYQPETIPRQNLRHAVFDGFRKNNQFLGLSWPCFEIQMGAHSFVDHQKDQNSSVNICDSVWPFDISRGLRKGDDIGQYKVKRKGTGWLGW